MVVYVKPQLHQLCRQQQQPSWHMNDTAGYGHLQQTVAGSSSLCMVQGCSSMEHCQAPAVVWLACAAGMACMLYISVLIPLPHSRPAQL
jgi:hypothetical protein